jgi:hypothetical protein
MTHTSLPLSSLVIVRPRPPAVHCCESVWLLVYNLSTTGGTIGRKGLTEREISGGIFDVSRSKKRCATRGSVVFEFSWTLQAQRQ